MGDPRVWIGLDTIQNERNTKIPNAQSQIQLWPPNEKATTEGQQNFCSTITITTVSSIENTIEKEETKGWRRYIGMILTLSSSLLFSCATLTAKLLQEYGFRGNISSFWRYLGIAIPAIPLLLYFDCNARRKDQSSVFDTVWPLNQDGKWKIVAGLLVRGFLGGLALILRYYALEYLSLADTAVITNSSTILVTILAHFFLGEKMGLVPVFVTITTLCGVILISHPPILTGEESFDPGKLIGIGLACASLVCAALIVIISRKIRDVHFSLMTFLCGVFGVALGFALSQYLDDFKAPEGLYDSMLVVVLAILAFLGQMTFIMGMQLEQAGPVSLLRCSDVVFGFILQLIFLGVIPTLLSGLGGTIVLLGVVVTGFRKYVSTLEDDDPKKKKMRYILK